MTEQYEALTPAQVERKLQFLTQELSNATVELRKARQAELAAKVAWQRSKRAALLHPDRPRVSRDGWTVAERDAWVEQQCADEADAYEAAKVARQAATDLVSTIEEQGRFVQSINKSVDTAYRMPGGSR